MQESKIVATKRLQDEGHWNEASLYREGIRETLRSEGMTRKEANRVAWEKMLEVFPPFDAEEEAAHWLCACYFPPAEAEHVKAVFGNVRERVLGAINTDTNSIRARYPLRGRAANRMTRTVNGL